MYHVKLSRFDHAWFCQIHYAYIAVQAKFCFLLLDKFFFKSIMLVSYSDTESFELGYTAVSTKVVQEKRKSIRDNTER